MIRSGTSSRCMGIATIALVLGLAGCAPYGGGGGGGYDDDDSTDGGGGDGSMTLTVYIENQTGYDFVAMGSAVNEAATLSQLSEPFANTAYVWQTQTFDDVVYGTQFHVAAVAMDGDGDCYDWESGGRDYNFGPELTVEIIFDFGHWLGGGCP